MLIQIQMGIYVSLTIAILTEQIFRNNYHQFHCSITNIKYYNYVASRLCTLLDFIDMDFLRSLLVSEISMHVAGYVEHIYGGKLC